MPFSDAPWDGSAEQWDTAEAYCNACLINENTGNPRTWSKSACHLPVKDSGGGYNRNGVHAAAGGRGITRLEGVSADKKRAAARKLISLYREMGELAPESVYAIAGERRPAEKGEGRK